MNVNNEFISIAKHQDQLSANMEHYIRIHFFSIIRGFTAFLFVMSIMFATMMFPFNFYLSLALVAILLAMICGLITVGIKATQPCSCGKISRCDNYKPASVRFLLRRLRAGNRLNLKTITVSLLAITTVILMPMIAHFLPAKDFRVAFCGLGSLMIFLEAVFLIALTHSKSWKKQFEYALLLSEVGFSIDKISDKTDDYLHELANEAYLVGRFEQADMISRYVLERNEKALAEIPKSELS